ncbi:hypothetical protein WJX77_010988 [Trebouxia sp. C0004]
MTDIRVEAQQLAQEAVTQAVPGVKEHVSLALVDGLLRFYQWLLRNNCKRWQLLCYSHVMVSPMVLVTQPFERFRNQHYRLTGHATFKLALLAKHVDGSQCGSGVLLARVGWKLQRLQVIGDCGQQLW